MSEELARRIHVQDFSRDLVVTTREQLIQVIGHRYQHEANRFTLADESLRYPWLNVYVRGEHAVLYYLPQEGEMFASAGGKATSADVEFFDSEHESHWLLGDAVVAWQDALVCILEFCTDLRRPKVIDWTAV